MYPTLEYFSFRTLFTATNRSRPTNLSGVYRSIRSVTDILFRPGCEIFLLFWKKLIYTGTRKQIPGLHCLKVKSPCFAGVFPGLDFRNSIRVQTELYFFGGNSSVTHCPALEKQEMDSFARILKAEPCIPFEIPGIVIVIKIAKSPFY